MCHMFFDFDLLLWEIRYLLQTEHGVGLDWWIRLIGNLYTTRGK
jgi:hypothetical protein